MFFKSKKYLFLLIFLLLVVFIIFNYLLAINKNIVVIVSDEHRYCESVNDCAVFQGSCNPGCKLQGVNEDFIKIYSKQIKKACLFNNPKLHCDPIFPEPSLVCENNKCVY